MNMVQYLRKPKRKYRPRRPKDCECGKLQCECEAKCDCGKPKVPGLIFAGYEVCQDCYDTDTKEAKHHRICYGSRARRQSEEDDAREKYEWHKVAKNFAAFKLRHDMRLSSAAYCAEEQGV